LASTEIAALEVAFRRDDFRRLSEFVREVLRYNIANGALEPGSRLIERELALRLGVSRIPVREAINRLIEDGLIEQRPHGRGAVVSRPNDEVLREFFEVRTGLECWAAVLAAERRTDEDLALLERVWTAGLDAAEACHFEDSRKLGRQWHDALHRASQNAHLVNLLASYDAKIAWRSLQAVAARGAGTWQEHRLIMDALRERNSAEASRLVRHHMEQHRQMDVVIFVEGEE
jgi:DNA-binding GntR family transcriptional regulator